MTNAEHAAPTTRVPSDEPFLLGVNYWPRRKAMTWWSDFDEAEVDEEFAVIAGLGMHVVRIFLLWDDWQPSPDTVSDSCLANLRSVCDLAQRHGLRLDVTFFTGHMSGPNWAPGWLLRDGPAPAQPYVRQVVSGGRVVASAYRNPYHDPEALAAQRLLLTTVVGALKDHGAIWMWNLGNEPDLFAWPDTPAAGRAWVADMTALIKGIDPDHPVTCGLHVASLLEDNRLRVHDVFAETDVAVMHAYPMYLPWSRDPLDPDLVPFTCALVSAMTGKPTLMEEWGGCTAPPGEASQVWAWTSYGVARTQFMASEDDLAAYVAAVLPKLVDAGASGALMWCFADYHEDLWDRPPCDEARHERHFGLVRPDGSLKPHAETIRAFARSAPRRLQGAVHRVELDVTQEAYYADPALHARRLYEAYLARHGL
jgi:endo-1,4-beta-mannosidase